MPRHPWEIEINSETPREALEECIIAAERTSDPNARKGAARARAALWHREQQEWRDRFNAESEERVNAQRFQEAQVTKQIAAQEKLMGQQTKVAEDQSKIAKGAATAAKWSAVATIAIAVLTAFLVAIGAFPLLAPESSDMPAPQPPPAATKSE